MRDKLGKASEASSTHNTRKNMVTAVIPFIKLVKELKIDREELARWIQEGRSDESSEKVLLQKLAVLELYVVKVGSKHSSNASTMKYVGAVNTFWRACGWGTLWTMDVMKDLHSGNLLRGLDRLRVKEKRVVQRQGLTVSQVVFLNTQTSKKLGLSNPRLVANIRALRAFAFQAMFRPGECTTPSNVKFDKRYRLTRADVSFEFEEGFLAAVRVTDPHYKNGFNNRNTRRGIMIYWIDNADLNGAKEIWDLFRIDAVKPEHQSNTPLFRDPSKEEWKQGGGTPIAPTSLTAWDRDIFEENQEMFPDHDREELTGYSYRIGAVMSLVKQGCPELVLQGMGRWKTDAYQQYMRESKELRREWTKVLAYKEDSRSLT